MHIMGKLEERVYEHALAKCNGSRRQTLRKVEDWESDKCFLVLGPRYYALCFQFLIPELLAFERFS